MLISVKNIGYWAANEPCDYGTNCQFNLSSSRSQITNFRGEWCIGTAPAPPPPPFIPHPPPPPPFGYNCSSSVCFSWTCGSHMVLQRAPHKAAVFGTIAGGTAIETAKMDVTVTPQHTGGGSAYSVQAVLTPATTAGGNATFKALLRPTPAGGNYSIVARCVTGCEGQATLHDLTYGDVWYCSGRTSPLHALLARRTRVAPSDSCWCSLPRANLTIALALDFCRKQHGAVHAPYVFSKQDARQHSGWQCV